MQRFIFAFSIFVLFIIISTRAESPVTKKEEEKPRAKKWGYVLSENLIKFPPEYIKKIAIEYDILCITGLKLSSRGQVRFTGPFMDKLKTTGLTGIKGKIIPMIVFSSVKEGIQFLKSESAQKKSSEEIIDFLTKGGFPGIHLDFEQLSSDNAERLGNYIKDLKDALNAKGLKLTMAVFPPLEFPKEFSALHPLPQMSGNIDDVVLMAYDWHDRKTEPGCVTGKEWAKKNIDELLKYFLPHEIWLGVPAYGYEWDTSSLKARVISAREAKDRLKHSKIERESSGCVIIEYGEKTMMRTYYSDTELRKQLEKIAQDSGLAGTALWRLGFEEVE